MKKLLLLMVVCLCAGMASAEDTTWTDGAADPNDHLWSTPENWDTSVVPTSADWAKIRNGPPGATVASEGAVCLKLAIGYDDGSILTVDGGTLTTVQDIVVGRNGEGTFNMISGTADIGRDLDIPYSSGDLGVVNMTGGTINIADDLELPAQEGQTGQLNMTGGTINIVDDLDMDATGSGGNGVLNMTGGTINSNDLVMDGNGSLNLVAGTINLDDDINMNEDGGSIDIGFGTLIVGDSSETTNGARIPLYISNGWITGFGLVGNLTVVNDGDTITVTATDPLQRTPGYDEEVNTVGNPNVDLSWINLDPNNPNDGVWVDVWFGADVDALTLEVDAELNTTGVTVSAPGNYQEYFWRVDTYRYGNPDTTVYGDDGDPNTEDFQVDEGILMIFTVVNDHPPEIVINTPRTVTWVNEPLLVEATVTDEGASEVTVTWDTSINSDPNEEYSDPEIVLEAGTTYPVVVSTYLTVDFDKGSFGMRANAADSAGNNWSEQVHHQCKADACAAAIFWWQQNGGVPQGELNADCAIDLGDLLLLVNEWLDDYTILVPTPVAP